MKLLLVEDNEELAHWVSGLLKAEQFSVEWAADGEMAETWLRSDTFDAVLLDMRLPGISGKDLLMRLRRARDSVPVLMLTANSSTDEKVACFAEGADDYIVKPFDARELVARIKAIIRRKSGTDGHQAIVCADLSYRLESREFFLKGEPLPLRRREHAVLETLILRQGKTVTKQALIERVFSIDDEGSADAIDLYIHRLRKHLIDSSTRILTLRGLGYIIRGSN